MTETNLSSLETTSSKVSSFHAFQISLWNWQTLSPSGQDDQDQRQSQRGADDRLLQDLERAKEKVQVSAREPRPGDHGELFTVRLRVRVHAETGEEGVRGMHAVELSARAGYKIRDLLMCSFDGNGMDRDFYFQRSQYLYDKVLNIYKNDAADRADVFI